jgi:hypothetical protein
MWNGTAELARIRRQELLAEAASERLARAARAKPGHPARMSMDVAGGPKSRPVSETVR